MSYLRCPLGGVDRELRVRVLPTQPGGVPTVELREFSRLPCDLGDGTFRPTDRLVHVPVVYAEHLADLLTLLAASEGKTP